MARNVYECMFIFDPNTYARDPAGVSGEIPKMVEDCNGEILASRLWNEQKLAYPIKGRRKGTYWLSYFRMDSNKVVAFNRACRLNDSILRNLTLKVEPRLVDVLVAHARGESLSADEEEEKPPATAEAKEVKVSEKEIPEGEAVEAMEGAAPEAKEGQQVEQAEQG